MNAQSLPDPSAGRSTGKAGSLLPFLLLACAAACLAISHQSLWIDEAQTALKGAPPTLAGWWHELYVDHTSNMEMPLHLLYIWVWSRFFGISELAVRGANLPFFFLGFYAIARTLRAYPRFRDATLLIYCIHPFVWYYLNEARPYMMQLGGGLMVCGALFEAFNDESRPLSAGWWWGYCLGIVLLCGAAMLGTAWAISMTILLFFHRDFFKSMLRSGWPALLVCGPVVAALAAYYAWCISLHLDAGYNPMRLSATLFAFYEHLGFLGLGPARNDMRIGGPYATGGAALHMMARYMGAVLVLAVPLAWGLFLALRNGFYLNRRNFLRVALVAGIPLLGALAAGAAMHTHVYGRQLTPLFPFILMAEVCAFLALWLRPSPIFKGAAVLLLCGLLLSSLELRFVARHFRDDYRDAAALAKQGLAEGKMVWWCADFEGACYYNLPVSNLEVPGKALILTDLPANITTPPAVIFLSKPDLFDVRGAVAQFIAAHHYKLVATFPAFTVWQP